MDRIRIEILRSEDMTEPLRDEIRDWLVSVFIDDSNDTVWSEPNWHILGWFEDQIVGHVDIVERSVLVGDHQFLAGGIGGVVTKEEWRGKGIGSRLMQSARRFMENEMAVELGLLMCDRDSVSFYQDLGWILLENPLVFDQPFGKNVFDDQVMALPLGCGQIPGGNIDIRGYPW